MNKHMLLQIYQSAEPVSMVVEKFKIMDDGVGKEGEKMEEAVDCSNNATKVICNNLKITDQGKHEHCLLSIHVLRYLRFMILEFLFCLL